MNTWQFWLTVAGYVWLAVLLLILLLDFRRSPLAGYRHLLRRLQPLGVVAVAAAQLVAGAWLLSDTWAWVVLGTGLAVLFGLLAALLLGGFWSRYAALGATALVVFGAGGLWLLPAVGGLVKLGRQAASLTLLEPRWLLLLLGIPSLFFLARRNLGLKVRQVGWLVFGVVPGILLGPLAGLRELGRFMGHFESWPSWVTASLRWTCVALLGVAVVAGLRELGRLMRFAESSRPWVSVGLRTALFALLALALAEPLLTRAGEQTTVLFVIDRSASIPEDPDPDRPAVDRRLRRIRNFVVRAVEQRGEKHDRDSVGVIVFGRHPRLELAPSDTPDLAGFVELPRAPDETATDIAAALEQAISSFLPDTNKRIVLLSDGNENLGRAEEVARKARAKGIEIDVVPLGAGQRNEDEVLIDGVHTERVARQGGKVAVSVQVRSYNPNVVAARLVVKESSDQGQEVKIADRLVKLTRGLNSFDFERLLTDEQRSYSYEAEILPLRVEDEQGRVLLDGPPPRDRVQNNRAVAHVVARGRRRVLILEDRARGKEDEVIHSTLVKKLKEAGDKKYKVDVQPVTILNRHRDRLPAYLSNFDCVVLANVPCDEVSEEIQEELRKNTHDHGCGLIMIGGESGFGAGGWQSTPVEKALPVDCDIKSLKVEGKGGLVLIMHACEMAQGNVWEKKIAKLALDRLGPNDEIGIIDFGFQHNWVVPLQAVGPNRGKILTAIDRMMPGDMPDVDPALAMAHKALTDPAKGISAKKVIFITDGDPQQTDATLLPKLRRDKVSVTTVIVVGHGQEADKQRMKKIAADAAPGGSYHFVDDANKLPAIYIKESRLVTQAFVVEKRFQPQWVTRGGPMKGLPDPLPPLGGFVRTQAKPAKNVVVSIVTPRFQDGQQFPLFAYWDYGLGKSAAFTSDADRPKKWSQEWVEGGVYEKFWDQTVDWCMRPTESDRVKMKTSVRDGRIIVRLEAEDDDKQPDARVRVQGRFSVTGGAGGADADKRRELRFVQREAGVYEAEIRAEDAGTYFITALATRKVRRDGKEVEEVETVRGAETLPLAPEFTVMRCNQPLLERIAAMTDGKVYDDDEKALTDAAGQPEKALFRPFKKPVEARLPLWYWLLFAAGFVLLADVAARRVAIDTVKARAWCVRAWLRLRGQMVPEPPREVVSDRLQARRAPADRGRAERRYEPGSAPVGPVPTADVAPPQSGAPRPAAAAEKPAEPPEDVMGRLARAKKKIMEDRKKDK